MTDTNINVREHYSAVGLADRIKAALATVIRDPLGLSSPERQAAPFC